MDLPGEAYLYNLSVLAITFAAVSALVMLLRQTMGGKMSNFDIHLITAYVSGGFVIAIDAILPPLIFLTGARGEALWILASGLAAILLAIFVVSVIRRRLKSAAGMLPKLFLLDTSLNVTAILLLVANAVLPRFQGVGLFAVAVSISMAMLFWTFVRRLASLVGERPTADWDPTRG